MGIAVTPLTAAIAERAAELRAAHDRLRLPDAIVLATARELGGPLAVELVRRSRDRRAQRLTQVELVVAEAGEVVGPAAEVRCQGKRQCQTDEQ